MNDLLFSTIVPTGLLTLGAAASALSVRLRSTSGRRVAARRIEEPLAHELPYWGFVDDDGLGIAVNVDGTYSTVLALEGVDVECLDEAARAQLTSALHSILQNVPTGAVLQVCRWTDRDIDAALARYRRSARGESAFGQLLVDAKLRHAASHPMLRRNAVYLVVSLPPTKTPGATLRKLRAAPLALTIEAHAATVTRLRTVANHVCHGLAGAGVGTRLLSSTDVRNLTYRLLHPTRSQIVPDPFRAAARPWSALETAREQLVFAGIEEDRDRLLVDRHLVRVITLKELPTQTATAMLDSLGVVFDFDCRVHFAVEILDNLTALDELKKKRDRAQMFAGLRQKRNQEAEAQAEDLGALIDHALRSTLRIVQVAVSVVLSVNCSTKDAAGVLERQTSDVLRELNRLYGAQGLVDEYAQLDEFLATLPANAMHGRRWLRCTSHNAAHLLPVSTAAPGDEEPLLLLHNARANLVGIDPYSVSSDVPNPNAFVAGTTGSGKSALTNAMLMSAVGAGARAIVIDIGGSYRRSIDVLGGDYFALDLGTCGINPFFAHADLFGDGADDDDRALRKQFLLSVLELMLRDPDRPSLRQAERGVIERALEETYARIYDRTPVLSDLVESLRVARWSESEDRKSAAALARALNAWTMRDDARFLNRPSTIALTDATTCAAFDLKSIGDDAQLQSVVLLCLSTLIWQVVMRDKTTRKLVVFDEVWKFFETPTTAKLIGELYRTSRKYKAAVITISQSMQDFAASPIAAALMNNAATAYLLRHERAHEEIAREFHLNDRELAIFRGLEMRRGHYTEAFVRRGQKHHFLARVVLTPLEYWIATTHPPDLALEEQYRARHPELSRLALLTRLAERYPHGAPNSSHPTSKGESE